MTWAPPASAAASDRLRWRWSARLAPRLAWRILALELAGCRGAERARASAHASKPLVRRDFVRRIRLTGLSEAIRFHVATAPLLAGQGQSGGGEVAAAVATS